MIRPVLISRRSDTSRVNRPAILSQIANITIAFSPHIRMGGINETVTEDDLAALRRRLQKPGPVVARARSTSQAADGDISAEDSFFGSDVGTVDTANKDDEEDSMCSTAAIVNGPSSPRPLTHSKSSSDHTAGPAPSLSSGSPSTSKSATNDAPNAPSNASIVTTASSHPTLIPRHPPAADLRPEKSAYSTLMTATNLRMGGIASLALTPNAEASAYTRTPNARYSMGPTPEMFALSNVFPQRLSDSKVLRETLSSCERDIHGKIVPFSSGSEIEELASGKGKDAAARLGGSLAGMLENLDVFVLPGESLLDQVCVLHIVLLMYSIKFDFFFRRM